MCVNRLAGTWLCRPQHVRWLKQRRAASGNWVLNSNTKLKRRTDDPRRKISQHLCPLRRPRSKLKKFHLERDEGVGPAPCVEYGLRTQARLRSMAERFSVPGKTKCSLAKDGRTQSNQENVGSLSYATELGLLGRASKKQQPQKVKQRARWGKAGSSNVSS